MLIVTSCNHVIYIDMDRYRCIDIDIIDICICKFIYIYVLNYSFKQMAFVIKQCSTIFADSKLHSLDGKVSFK